MAAEYEHLVFDIRYPALAVISTAVRAVINGTTDMAVQAELHNFANDCDNRIQHHAREVQKETIAKLNAEHAAGTPIIHRVITGDEDLDDLN